MAGEVGGNPLAKGAEEGGLVLLEGGALARVEGRGKVVIFSAEDGPGGVVVDGDVELTLVLVNAEVGSVETDDVADLVADWEVLEALSVDNNGGVVVVGGFTAL